MSLPCVKTQMRPGKSTLLTLRSGDRRSTLLIALSRTKAVDLWEGGSSMFQLHMLRPVKRECVYVYDRGQQRVRSFQVHDHRSYLVVYHQAVMMSGQDVCAGRYDTDMGRINARKMYVQYVCV